MPKLRRTFDLMSRPFWWPITITGRPMTRASPPTIAASSAYIRSPANSWNSSQITAT